MKHGTDLVDTEGNALLRLLPADDIGKYGIAVRPRWPYKEVLVTPEALAALRKASAAAAGQLPGLKLALIRGYETPVQTFRRNLLRLLGLSVFFVCYPWRYREIPGIFSPNGHDRSGNHVDVRFSLGGQNVKLLRYGPLTSLPAIRCTMERFDKELKIVRGALEACGFCIHPNISEALQIHCDLKNPVD